MDAILSSTALGDAVSAAFSTASKVGAPPWLLGGIAVLALALAGYRFRGRLASLKAERAPEAISDGGTASDRDLPAAREGGGPPGGENGDAG